MEVQYQAIVFQSTTDTEDFSCSRQVMLPGQHTAEEAWRAVRAALREPGTGFIGGDVRPC